jgi:DNA repair exonuclease SbcCD ATPase subunit
METESFGPKILKKIEDLESRLRVVEKREPEERDDEVARLRRELKEARSEAKEERERREFVEGLNRNLEEELEEVGETRERLEAKVDDLETALADYTRGAQTEIDRLRLALDLERTGATEEREKREFLEGERRKALAEIQDLKRQLIRKQEHYINQTNKLRLNYCDEIKKLENEREALFARIAELEAVPRYGASAREIVDRVMCRADAGPNNVTIDADDRREVETEIEKAFQVQTRELLGVRRWAVIHLYEEGDLPDDVPNVAVEWFDSREEAARTAELPRECGEAVLAAIGWGGPPKIAP